MAKAKTATPKSKATPAKPVKKSSSVFDAIDQLPEPGWRAIPKFAADERAGRLLALGYPRMILTSAGDFDGTDDKLMQLASNTRIIPRGVLTRFYNLYAADRAKRVELGAAVTQSLEGNGNHFALYALEQLFGSVATATAFVDALERYPKEAWTTKIESNGGIVISGLGFVLWRVPAKSRDALRARLQTLHAKVAAERGRAVDALDHILHGRAGAERIQDPNSPFDLSDLAYADDDPAWLASQVVQRLASLRPADRELFDIQLAVVGGPKVLAALRAGTAKFRSEQKKSIAAQLSLCR